MLKKFLAVNIIFITLTIIYFKVENQPLVIIRSAFFAELTNNKGEFYKMDDFIYENESLISQYNDSLTKLINYTQINNTEKCIEKAKLISLSYSVNGSWKFEHKDLISKFTNLQQRKGVCSDHSEIFIALSHLFNFKAREVHNEEHTFNEFYCEELKKWIWIDSQFGLLAYKNDTLLNLLEMKNLYDSGIIPDYKCFGDSNFTAFEGNPSRIKYYDNKDDFSTIMLTKGNNVFENDYEAQKVDGWPKTLKQLYLLVSGVQPNYRILYTNENDKIKTIKRLKNISYFILISWILSNILLVVYFKIRNEL